MQNKLEVKKIRKKTLQEWLPIQKIYDDGIVKTKDNRLIKIIKINPINYNLKSDLEKEAILNSYKIFLKTCNFDIQILIQSNKRDLTPHIKNIQKNISKKENKYLKEISKEYINYINKINLNRKSASKDFFIIISNKINSKKDSFNSEEILKNDLKEKYFKIKECLSRSGNSVFELSTKQEIEKIFFSFLNTKKYLNKKI
ncbi:MAG: hypothetical protein V8R81_08275 [Clostridia bacterium]